LGLLSTDYVTVTVDAFSATRTFATPEPIYNAVLPNKTYGTAIDARGLSGTAILKGTLVNSTYRLKILVHADSDSRQLIERLAFYIEEFIA
jgi:hypothetical protein